MLVDREPGSWPSSWLLFHPEVDFLPFEQKIRHPAYLDFLRRDHRWNRMLLRRFGSGELVDGDLSDLTVVSDGKMLGDIAEENNDLEEKCDSEGDAESVTDDSFTKTSAIPSTGGVPEENDSVVARIELLKEDITNLRKAILDKEASLQGLAKVILEFTNLVYAVVVEKKGDFVLLTAGSYHNVKQWEFVFNFVIDLLNDDREALNFKIEQHNALILEHEGRVSDNSIDLMRIHRNVIFEEQGSEHLKSRMRMKINGELEHSQSTEIILVDALTRAKVMSVPDPRGPPHFRSTIQIAEYDYDFRQPHLRVTRDHTPAGGVGPDFGFGNYNPAHYGPMGLPLLHSVNSGLTKSPVHHLEMLTYSNGSFQPMYLVRNYDIWQAKRDRLVYWTTERRSSGGVVDGVEKINVIRYNKVLVSGDSSDTEGEAVKWLARKARSAENSSSF